MAHLGTGSDTDGLESVRDRAADELPDVIGPEFALGQAPVHEREIEVEDLPKDRARLVGDVQRTQAV